MSWLFRLPFAAISALLVTLIFELAANAQQAAPVQLEGFLQSLAVDEIDQYTGQLRSRLVHFLRDDDGRLVEVDDSRGLLRGLRPPGKVRLSVTKVGTKLVISEVSGIGPAEPRMEKPEVQYETIADTIGEQKTLVALFNYPDKPNKPFTVQEIKNRILANPDSTDKFLRENSYGKLWLNADFIDWKTLPGRSTEYGGT